MVTNCAGQPQLQQPYPDPAKLQWQEESKVQHYRLSVNIIAGQMQVREDQADYG